MNTCDIKNDFRAFLQLEFTNRCRRNAHYSLRAFALSLGIDASSLSQFLRHKRNLSDKKMKTMALKLGLSEEDFKKFIDTNHDESFHSMAADHFMVLSEWYHLAICELCHLHDFVYDYQWIGQRIGISQLEVQAAIERLKRIGWLEEEGSSLRYVGGDMTTINSEISLSALGQLQKQMLEKASHALDAYSLDERSQTGMTMSISRDKLEQADLMITKFRRKLCKFLEDSDKRDDVYHLSISLFPLTKH